jgi:hypothetical protein
MHQKKDYHEPIESLLISQLIMHYIVSNNGTLEEQGNCIRTGNVL